MKKYIDLHAHPFKEYFEFPESIIEESYDMGVGKIFIVGTSLEDSREVKSLSSKYGFTFPIIGIHPNNAKDKLHLDTLRTLVDSSIVGIGEIGLDFHYENSPSFEQQQIFFRYQIELANEFNIPIIVHTRDATQETYDILKAYKSKNKDMKIIIHSYSSGPDWVQKFLDIGAYLSFSGVATFKNAKDVQDSIIITPIDKLFYETDTPYLAPMPMRGKINVPHYAIHTAKFIANLKGVTVDFLNEQVNKNIFTIFNICGDKNE
ncbi:MAG: TatD family hydrolase [Mycoplasmataceae bacterium]|nr:TatD family hydrolase [Mycoplasmataceae bacterium]